MAPKKLKKRAGTKSGGGAKGRRVRTVPRPRVPETRRTHPIEIIARGCLIEGTRILLCKNLKHGYLYLPGGHVEFNESAPAALLREFLEECGVAVRVGELVLISEGAFATKKRMHHEINLVFHVERVGAAGKPVVSHEDGIAFEWLDFAAVPEADIRPTAAKAFLAALGVHGPGHVEWVSEFAGG